MNYYLTKHSKKRRKDSIEYDDNFLISWLNEFNKIFNFETLNNGKYKIISKYKNKDFKTRNPFLVIDKNKNKLTLITFLNFKKEYKKNILENVKIINIDKENKIDIYRYNLNNDKIKCGVIKKNNNKFNVEFEELLNKKYETKFLFKRKLIVKNLEDLNEILVYNKSSKHYILKDLKRKETNEMNEHIDNKLDLNIYFKDVNNVIKSCGKIFYKKKKGLFGYKFDKKYKKKINLNNMISIKELTFKEMDFYIKFVNNKIFIQDKLLLI